MVYHEVINLIKRHLVMFSLGCDAFSFFFYKYNDAAYGKKGNKRDKEYSLLKHDLCVYYLSVYLFH